MKFGNLDLRHQFPADNRDHLLQLGAVLGREPMPDAVHNLRDIGGADVVIVDILLGDLQVILPPVLGGLNLADIPLLDQAVNLIGRIWRRNAHKGSKLVDGGTAQGLDSLHGEGLHRGQTGLPVLKAPKDLLVKMELEFGIHVKKSLVQHNIARFPAMSVSIIFGL